MAKRKNYQADPKTLEAIKRLKEKFPKRSESLLVCEALIAMAENECPEIVEKQG